MDLPLFVYPSKSYFLSGQYLQNQFEPFATKLSMLCIIISWSVMNVKGLDSHIKGQDHIEDSKIRVCPRQRTIPL